MTHAMAPLVLLLAQLLVVFRLVLGSTPLVGGPGWALSLDALRNDVISMTWMDAPTNDVTFEFWVRAREWFASSIFPAATLNSLCCVMSPQIQISDPHLPTTSLVSYAHYEHWDTPGQPPKADVAAFLLTSLPRRLALVRTTSSVMLCPLESNCSPTARIKAAHLALAELGVGVHSEADEEEEGELQLESEETNATPSVSAESQMY